jgi:hypothetical protein
MGNNGAKFFGMESAFVPVEDSVTGLTKLVCAAFEE